MKACNLPRMLMLLGMIFLTMTTTVVNAQYGYGGTTEAENEENDDTATCSFTREQVLGQGTDNIVLKQYLNVADQTVTVQMTYPGQAWLGFAFSSSMIGSTAVIGVPGSTPTLYTLGGYVPELVTPASADVQAQLQDATIEQNDQQTVMQFTLPATFSGSASGPTTVQAGSAINVLYAVGSSNTLGIHANKAATTITFDACTDTGDEGDDNNNGGAPAVVPTTTVTVPTDSPVASITTTAAPSASVPTGAVPTPAAVKEDGVLNLAPGVTFRNTVIDAGGSAEAIEYTVVYEGQAWLSVGFSKNGNMVGSEAVIGLPDQPVSDTNPGKYQLSGQSVAGVQLMPDAQQTLQNAIIKQNETHTVLQFTKLTSEADEIPVLVGSSNTFLYAVGSSNQLGLHGRRSSFSLVPGSNDAAIDNSSEPNKSLWIAHGVCMFAAWGVLVPIAIGASVLRKLLPAGDTWFKFHYYVNVTALLLTIIGFLLAVVATQQEEDEHFQGPPKHKPIGLVITILAVIQGAVASFRPHPPGTETPDHSDAEGQQQQEKTESEAKTAARFLWETKHRITAAVLLGLAWYNVDTGLSLFAENFAVKDISNAFWGVTGSLVGLIVVTKVLSTVMSKKE